MGPANTCGAIVGRIRTGPFTFLRVDTDDAAGCVRAYVGEGRFTDDPLETFGGYGVAEVPGLQRLLAEACLAGFEHHVAVAMGRAARAIDDALSTYLGWDVYHHAG